MGTWTAKANKPLGGRGISITDIKSLEDAPGLRSAGFMSFEPQLMLMELNNVNDEEEIDSLKTATH